MSDRDGGAGALPASEAGLDWPRCNDDTVENLMRTVMFQMRILTVVCLCFLSVPATAQTPLMPTYDVSAVCAQQADEKSCVERQYLAQWMAAEYWPKLSEKAQRECAKVNKWSDYRILWTCVQAHVSADKFSAP